MKDEELKDCSRRIKASDPTAFKSVFNLFHDAIFNFLLFKTKDPALAEDLLQEVFFKLWKSRSNLNENLSLKNYLYTIADNLVLNHFRHLKVVKHYEGQVKIQLFSSMESPHFKLEEKEWYIILMNAIAALPEKTRIIFLMSRLEDLTYHEIADRLSFSVKTVEGHFVKALKLLRETISIKI